MKFKQVTHVLFDLDGLLIDSEPLYSNTFEKVCSKYGKTFTWDVKKSILGRQGHECADIIIRSLELPVSREDFMTQCHEENEIQFRDVQFMPGATKLVQHLHNKGIPIALATSSADAEVQMKLRNNLDFLKLFHHVTMGSSDPEVKNGKPDPAIFLVCASRFPDKPRSEDCLVFEDAVNGIKAGVAANMQVVAVPDPRIEKEQLAAATVVLTSLEEFKPEWFGLPAFD